MTTGSLRARDRRARPLQSQGFGESIHDQSIGRVKRRWKIVTGLAIATFVGVGVVLLYFKEYAPDRLRLPVRGIDVSHHQGRIDWSAVAADDVAFVYMKASEGGDHRDREFLRNIDEAGQFGLAVGAYHFFTFCRPGVDQAMNFIEAVSPVSAVLPPVVDLEFLGNCSRRPAPDELAGDVAAFLAIVESRFKQPVLYYATEEFLDAYGDAIPPRRLWVRSILREPDREGWTIWQYHPAGRVDGIEGDVDLNVLSGSLDDLMRTDGGA